MLCSFPTNMFGKTLTNTIPLLCTNTNLIKNLTNAPVVCELSIREDVFNPDPALVKA